MDIAEARLRAQHLVGAGLTAAREVVGWFGAVQSQDYRAASWGLGLRVPGLTQAAVDEAYDAGEILRTHVLRPTWHFLLPQEARAWLELTGPRIMASLAHRQRFLELDAPAFPTAFAAFERALRGGHSLTRAELGAVLKEVRISPAGQRLPHLLLAAELERLVISGPRRGHEFTWALFEERVPQAAPFVREETLARLALAYFRSHGPATARDFAWWSGLRLTDVREALALVTPELEHYGDLLWSAQAVAGTGGADAVHLLPNFDEYTVAYRDRSALDGPHEFDPGLFSFGSVLSNVITVGGRLRGAWRRAAGRVEVRLLGPLTAAERAGIETGVAELARFAGSPVRLDWR